jgi:hypothetical protein
MNNGRSAIAMGIALATSLVLAQGCAGAAKATDSPARAPDNAAPPGGGYPASSAPATPSMTTTPSTTGTMAAPDAARSNATEELRRAQRDLEASASDCAAACRALASMERATVHLCDLADQPDDRARCDDAKAKLRDARDRVKRTCSSCPGGPSVDRNGPIPSTR